MILALVALALYAFAGEKILEQLRKAIGASPEISRRHVAGAACLAAAAIMWTNSRPQDTPTPAPPAPDAGIVLAGTFVGPDAAVDAATVSALMDELAAEIEWDGMQGEPLIRTGVAVDDLRQRARELRCRGVSLGEKHPRAREAIRVYLDGAAGTSGGPLSGAQRSAWVSAYRTVARAAADAAR